jgi:4-hydroxybenzoate polyprenyltransferase
MRPKQWVKNVLLFAGLIFSHNLFELSNALRAVAGFFVFCLLSGTVYIINDLLDRENDRTHPEKAKRPIASGKVGAGPAMVWAGLCLAGSLAGAWFLGWRVFAVGAGYFVMQLAYSLRLKRVVILDVMIVAAGFVLRAIAGTYVVGVTVSPWMFVCIILLSLFVALAKRRHELVSLQGEAASHRSVLGNYSEPLLDQMMAVATSSTVIAYCLYTIAPETVAKVGSHNLLLTVPFVLYGIYRYLYLVYHKKQGGAPERLFLSDVPLIVDAGLYLAAVVAALYFKF